jgi:ADP-ribose pyrophosphatase YjhB (NUDIX family)
MSFEPGILARGPWPAEKVRVRWREDVYEPHADKHAEADTAIAALRDRGSPSHDGMAARLAAFRVTSAGGPNLSGGQAKLAGGSPKARPAQAETEFLELELQPMRWGLRLVEEDASASISVQCVVRDASGRWLAGRRAPWVATWAGRWALGAGGAVEVGEDPVVTLTRELVEEWGVEPERSQVEALLCLPNRLIMLVGQAWLPDDAPLERDHEHDAHAWWPVDPADWPPEADPALKLLAGLIA